MDIHSVLQNLPDLHMHLGQAVPAHNLWEIAHERGMHLFSKNYWEFIKTVTLTENASYDTYLSFFDFTEKVQSSPLGIEKSAYAAVSHFYRHAAGSLLELRFNPMLRNAEGEKDLDKIIWGAIIGAKRATLEYPVKVGIILMMDRRFTPVQNLVIAKKAIHFAPYGVVGIDIAGPITKKFKVSDIIIPVQLIKQAGLKVTIHTGEATDCDEMWEVVTTLEPDRIGHGIRAINDARLMRHLAQKKIVLEICPTSNIRTQTIKDWDAMRDTLHTFMHHDVPFTINSDGPELMSTNVRQELHTLYEKEILSLADIKRVIARGHRATFTHSISSI